MNEDIPAWAIELIKQVERLNEKVPSHVDWVERNIKDFEFRIRELEKARWQSAWLSALASALLTGVSITIINSVLF